MKKQLIIALLLSQTICYAQRNVPSYIDTTDLAGWYPFNGNADDSAAIDPTQTNTDGEAFNVMLIPDRHNKNDNAYHFKGLDGGESYIHLKSGAFSNKGYTISVWAKMDVPAYKKRSFIISSYTGSKWNNGTEKVTGIGADDSSCYFYATENDSASYIHCNPTNDNNWHHFVAVMVNDSVLLYIDDTLKATKKIQSMYGTGSMVAGFKGAHILNNIPDWGFRGAIDDVAIWNKALTRKQITDLYKAIHIPPTTSINNIQNDNPINIFPNPANNIIRVNCIEVINKIEIVNMVGKIVFTKKYNGYTADFDLSNLIAGQYIIRVNNYTVKFNKF